MMDNRRQHAPLAPRRLPPPDRDAGGPAGVARAAGVAFAVVGAVLLTLHTLLLLSAEPAATRTLRAMLPVLTDVDQALATHTDDMRATAASGAESVTVPGVPMAVAVPREAVAVGGPPLRDAVLAAMAARVYRDGHAAFRAVDAPAAGPQNLFSSQWAVQRSLDPFTEGAHQRLSLFRLIAAAAAALLLVALLLLVQGNHRLVALGSALAAAALLAGVVALAARAAAWLLTSFYGEVAAAVVNRAAHTITIGIAAGALVVLVAGVAVAAIGVVSERAARPVERRRPAAGRGDVMRGRREEW